MTGKTGSDQYFSRTDDRYCALNIPVNVQFILSVLRFKEQFNFVQNTQEVCKNTPVSRRRCINVMLDLMYTQSTTYITSYMYFSMSQHDVISIFVV